MPELSVDAIGVAFVPPDYQRAQALDPGAEFAMQAGGVAHFSGVPMERLLVLRSELDGESDVSSLALACLGPPAEPQPLFLVRSGPERDPYVVELARIVHGAAWAGEDVGITHLDELGGTLVFDLLDWAVPAAGATVLVCDDPAYVDESQDTSRIGAVAIRLRRGPGPLRVLGCGEGSPGAVPDWSDHLFVGSRPCDSWLALHAAVADGRVTDGQQLLLYTKGPTRAGWLSLAAVDVAGLRLAGRNPTVPKPMVGESPR
ncbi:MAG TPA: hypothetical protein VM677_21060 [Actinokineospora sp.]|jgi:hypothetical protein|nr:hypothetical protein [Actinokineospora sp.]